MQATLATRRSSSLNPPYTSIHLSVYDPVFSWCLSVGSEIITGSLIHFYSPLELPQVRISRAGTGFSWRRPKIAIMYCVVFRNLLLVKRSWLRLTLMRGPVIQQLVVVDFSVSLVEFPLNWNCSTVSYEGFSAKLLPFHVDLNLIGLFYQVYNFADR